MLAEVFDRDTLVFQETKLYFRDIYVSLTLHRFPLTKIVLLVCGIIDTKVSTIHWKEEV